MNKEDSSFAWENIAYSVNEYSVSHFKKRQKIILNGLNGCLQTSSLNAVLGPSGAGKSTLLKILSGEKNTPTAHSTNSSIYVSKTLEAPLSFLIEQHVQETVFGSLTVGQTFEYAFVLKNGTSGKVNSQREGHIKSVMGHLLLSNDLLGRRCDQCSGGELKRVVVGQELMSLVPPSFCFFDEPTTGLDSLAAVEMITCLKALTSSSHYQITIIVTIHTPSLEILQQFDKLFVLAKGGYCVYAGTPEDIRSTLQKVVNHKMVDDSQPIEDLVAIACQNCTPTTLKLAKHFKNQELKALLQQKSNMKQKPNRLSKNRKMFQITDFVIVLCRLFNLLFVAQWKLCAAQLIIQVMVMLLFISIFNYDMVKPSGCAPVASSNKNISCFADLEIFSLVRDNINFLNLSADVFWYITLATACVTLMPMINVFRNEYQNRWYSLGSFYFSFTIVYILQLIVFAIVLTLVIYFVSNLYTIDARTINWIRLGNFFFSVTVFSLFTQSIGQALAVIFLNSVLSGLIFSIILHTIITMISDLFMNTSDIDSPLFSYLNEVFGIKYLYSYLLYIFYGIDRCKEDEFSYILLSQNIENSPFIFYKFAKTFITNTIVIRLLTFILLYLKFNSPFELIWMALKKKSLFLNNSKTVENSKSSAVKILNVDLKTVKVKIENKKFKPQNEIVKVIFAWRNVSLYCSNSIYELNTPKSEEIILRNINGQLNFGTLVGVLGPSGSGKTTLLKTLNGQLKDKLSEESTFYVSKCTPIRTCFITQDVSNHLWPGLTAKQALVYASRLKNSSVVRQTVDHEAIALSMLEQLDLLNIVHTKLEKCSGGERQRIALGQELTSVHMPNFVQLDECCSGLDSTSAEIVISCLRSLAKNHNITIILSIHQTNSKVLQMFDQIFVLARGGVNIFQGPPKTIQHHLHSLSSALPANDNVLYSVETLLKYASLGQQSSTVKELCQINNQQYKLPPPETDCQVAPDGLQRPSLRLSFSSLGALTSRYLLYTVNYQLFEWLSFIACLLLFARFMLFFWQSHRLNDQLLKPFCVNIADDETGGNLTCSAKSIQRLEDFKVLELSAAFNFFIHLMVNFLFAVKSSSHFFGEFPRLVNEHRNGYYSAGSFYIMKAVFEVALATPLLMVYLVIADLFEPIRPGMYWYTLGTMLLSMVAWQSMTHVIVFAFSENLLLQYMMQISVNTSYSFLANFILPLPHLHYVYRFFANFSIQRFTFEATILLQHGFGRCDARHQLQPLLYWMGIKNSDDHFAHCILMLIFNLILYRVIAIWLLVRKLNPSEKRHQRVSTVRHHLLSMKPVRSTSHGLSSSLTNYT